MNENKQPEALRLAELFEFESEPDSLYRKAAAELRRLHKEVQELRAALLDMALDYKESMTKWSDD